MPKEAIPDCKKRKPIKTRGQNGLNCPTTNHVFRSMYITAKPAFVHSQSSVLALVTSLLVQRHGKVPKLDEFVDAANTLGCVLVVGVDMAVQLGLLFLFGLAFDVCFLAILAVRLHSLLNIVSSLNI